MTLQEIFKEAAEAGSDKNGIMTALLNDGVLPADLESTYNKLARELGYVLTREEKAAKQATIFSEADLSTEEGVTACRERLVAELDISPSTAQERIRLYAKAEEIELPGVTSSRAKADKASVVAYLIAHKGEKRSEVAQGLMREFGYLKGSADSFLTMLPYMEEFARQSQSQVQGD
jgi:hypothetical protein